MNTLLQPSKQVVNGLTYAVWQGGDGPPLVMLHGFTGSSLSWDVCAEQFVRDFHVVLIDLPGHGETDAPGDFNRYTMDWVSQDLVALIQRLELDSVFLLGYSMGGRLALYLATHYPTLIKRLVLESASPGLDNEAARAARTQQDNTLADRIEREGIPAFVDYWENIPLFTSQRNLPVEKREALRSQRLMNRESGLANSLRGMGTGVQPSLWRKLSELTMPVLLVVGAEDSKFVGIAGEMSQILPDVQTVVVQDAGHTVHLEQTVQYCTVVREFLRS